LTTATGSGTNDCNAVNNQHRKKNTMSEDLEEHTVEELKHIAAREGADVPSHANKPEIIKAIEKNRKSSGKTAGKTTAEKSKEGSADEPEAIKNQRERFEATNYGPEPLPADDPRRAPRPETVDPAEQAEKLEQADRAFRDAQGAKA
jgi:hypothetical protein